MEWRQKWPLNEWPKDPHHKLVGAWTRANLDKGIVGLVMALLTRNLGWTKDEVLAFFVKVRPSLKDRRVHGYIPM